MEAAKTHIVQSKIWGEIKTKLGTKAVHFGGVQFTKHKIPFTGRFYGYAPKVNPAAVDFQELRKAARNEGVIAINFDCPNIIQGTPEEKSALELFRTHSLKKAPRSTFAKGNVLLDISKTEEELLSNMHAKCRYNINYAQKNGITVEKAGKEGFDIFFQLFEQTAERQKFYIHSRNYYETIFTTFQREGMAEILIASLDGNPLSAWLFLFHEGVMYYIYGGWSGKSQNLFPNNLLCFEGIKLGKAKGCKMFDMWGAATDPNDTKDEYYGFTNFKLKFGGKHVVYMDSYDLILDPALYHSFNTANSIRWLLLKALKS